MTVQWKRTRVLDIDDMRRRWAALRSVLWMCDMTCMLFQYVDA